jgi:hypothetical protein
MSLEEDQASTYARQNPSIFFRRLMKARRQTLMKTPKSLSRKQTYNNDEEKEKEARKKSRTVLPSSWTNLPSSKWVFKLKHSVS